MEELAPGTEIEQGTSQVRLRASEYAETEPRAVGTVYKVAIATYADTALARDMVQVTPHFRDTAGTQSPAALATQIANNMVAYLQQPAQGSVKVYLEDFQPQLPHNPLAHADFGTPGTYIGSSGPREIALCLSYYAGQNTKRYRGRLYIPHVWLRASGGGPISAPGPRPVASTIATALSFATAVLKPSNLNGNFWAVASTVDKVPRTVTNYWVDDEWDIVRSRGFRGTSRQTGTIP